MGSAGVNCMSVVIGPQTLWISADRQWPASLVRTSMWNWARRWTNSYLNLLPPLINIQHFCPVSIESLTLKLLWDIPQHLWMKVVPCTSHPFFQSSQLFCKPHCLLQRKACWATLYRHLSCCYCCCFLPLRFNSESFKTANIVNYFWENKAMNSFLCLYFSLQYIFYLFWPKFC